MLNYIWTDIKMILRVPLSVFFSIVYPIMMMFIIILSYGNMSIGGDYHLIDKYFLITIGMGILPFTLVSFPIWIASQIEDNSLKRLQYFRVSFFQVIFSDIISHFIVALLSMILNILVAFFIFNLKVPSFKYFAAFLGQYILAIIVFMLMGGFIALILKKQQIVMPFGLVIMFALYMFCGAFITFDQLPKAIQDIASYIPMKYAMIDFFNIWSMTQYGDKTFLILSLLYICVLSLGIFLAYKKSYER